ncbi:HPr kinase/phosphorylase [Pseudooceanicola sp. MF1-13]|uniref:HPr kinase/phosphorylase n=1 Tax=Pseudooceanicola sp. MF1-13 TaxID=3379095 RepID=UPI003891418B
MGGGGQTQAPDQTILHANTVALNGRALLIQGPSGAGKSMLSVGLMALGAVLVADDRTVLRRVGAGLVASVPPAIAGQIEARGIGILKADHVEAAEVSAVVDLATPETDRLPPQRSTCLLGITLPVLHYVESPYFAAALMQYLRYGRYA